MYSGIAMRDSVQYMAEVKSVNVLDGSLLLYGYAFSALPGYEILVGGFGLPPQSNRRTA
jgi:hypothetical protein